ncbi:thioredoxin family protein [Patescibacteria group bacterium]|nr:thioredoxin family protein [Patescibacteria group bacterium]
MLDIKDKNLIILVLLVACGILAGGLVYTQFGQKIEKNVISSDEAANLALDYINENLLGGQIKASLAGEVEEERGLYKLQIDIGGEKFFSYITRDGKILFPQGIDLEEELTQPEEKAEARAEEKSTTLGNFSVSDDEVCLEDEKPIIYFFGSEGCSHCKWEHPIIEEVAEKFTGFISFHNNMDSSADMDVFSRYSTGGIPTLVLGCKYYRVGSGEGIGEEEEARVLTALICDLTENQATDVCEYD